ncbi:MAG: DUF2490 domain-containing protein [Flavobacteriales bacterium]|nr:DUF2490 domain-containing protein [Flavobacteriales bacterium]
MRVLISVIIAALFGGFSIVDSFAQRQTFTESGYLWQRYYFKGQLSERINLHVEAERRTFKTTSLSSQALLPRIHVHYKFKHEMDVGMGIAHFMNYIVLEKDDRNILAQSEIRLHQEWNLFQDFGRLRINHRYQLEERMFKNYETEFMEVVAPLSFGFRLRYLIQLQVRMTPEAKKVKVYLKVYDELLLQTSKLKPYQLIDSNRLYGGVQVQFSPVWALEAGYLTYIQQQTASRYFVPHIARITLTHSIDFRKTKDQPIG